VVGVHPPAVSIYYAAFVAVAWELGGLSMVLISFIIIIISGTVYVVRISATPQLPQPAQGKVIGRTWY